MSTGAYSAEFGRSQGGLVNLSIRSGTNEYHGTAYENLRNNIFDARNFVNEIVWKRSDAHNDFGQGAHHLGRLHDILLFYRKSEAATFNPIFTPLPQQTIDTWYKHIEPGTGDRPR